MKQLEHIYLTPAQAQRLAELLCRLYAQFHVVSVILHGSVARGEADEESDIDLEQLRCCLSKKPSCRMVFLYEL
jgi:predicted nucleotidyltransferase